MRVFALLLLFVPVFNAGAQTTTISIFDSNGGSSTGTISGGNVYFHDSNGNTAFGTIRNGNVFLSTDKGEITFGTIRDGNVFLSDGHGTTTGTIRNGNIFLSGSDGSITTGTYNGGTATTSTTTSPIDTTAEQERQKQIDQQNYEAGKAIGQSIGLAINGAIANHRITSFCKGNPESTYQGADGISTPCPQAPMDSWEQSQIDEYCQEHPGLWIEIGRHRTDCVTAPNPPTPKWAKWEIDAWRENYRDRVKIKSPLTSDQLRENWLYWRQVYCGIIPGGKYKNLDGKKESCSQ
jgi:hypothetical protein